MFNANHPLYFGNFLSKFRTILFNLHKDDSIDTRENPLRNPLLRNIHNIHYIESKKVRIAPARSRTKKHKHYE